MNFPIALKLNIRSLEGPLLYQTKGRWKDTAPAMSYNGHHNRQLFWMSFMEMATHSSVLAWRIPGMEEPGGLPSLGSHRVGHDWSDLAAAAAAAPSWAFLVAQTVKNLPAVWETQVRSLGWEDPLEKGLATHSSILAWRSPWTEEPGGLWSIGSQRVSHDWVTFSLSALTDYVVWAWLPLRVSVPSGKFMGSSRWAGV